MQINLDVERQTVKDSVPASGREGNVANALLLDHDTPFMSLDQREESLQCRPPECEEIADDRARGAI